MTRLVNSRPFWSIRPRPEEYLSLESILGLPLHELVKERIDLALFHYSADQATRDQGIAPARLRKRLIRIAKSCRRAASALGCQDTLEDDFSVVDPPRNWAPREGEAFEARKEMRHFLRWREYQLRNAFSVETQLSELEPLQVGWRLLQLASAAEAAVARIQTGTGGRPDSGARSLVEAIVSELLKGGVRLSCAFDSVDEQFKGTFAPVAQWLISLGVDVPHSTLCQYGAEVLRGLAKKEPNKLRRDPS